MELFVVNRYTGADTSAYNSPNEDELKNLLLEKVEQRKKLSKNVKFKEDGINSSKLDNSNEVPTPITKELQGNNTGQVESNDLADNASLGSKKKKKLSEPATDLSESEIPKKKKKKKLKDKSKRESVNETETGDLNTGGANSQEAKPFFVLGSDTFLKPQKVKRSIPQWLANPSIVSVDLKKAEAPIDSIPGLDKMFVEKLKENKITHFFPVQKQIIPWLLENMKKPNFYWPSDICVSAPTGSGKTLAFVLPILEALRNRLVPEIRAIVILPVHDLAAQVHKVFEDYSSPTKLNILLLSKKRPFAEEQNLIRKKDEFNGFTTLVDVIVTTAGRLVDHLMNTDGLSLKDLRYLVIDEADRVVEDMQNDWLYHLNKKILSDSSKSYQTPILTYNTLAFKKRLPQKMLFSATLSQDPEKLQQLGLFQPKLFTSIVSKNIPKESDTTGRFIGKYTTPAELKEFYMLTSKAMKPLAIHNLLLTESWRSVLCFVNTNEATKRLSFLLKKMNKSVTVKNISAKLSPHERDKLIQDFGTGKIDVLISSDALARGIDIPNVKYVISYDCPKYIKGYVHRIGRTGRAGKEGVSLILLTDKENGYFKQMIEDAGNKSVNEMAIDEESLEKYVEEYKNALRLLESNLRKKKEMTLSVLRNSKRKNKSFKKLFSRNATVKRKKLNASPGWVTVNGTNDGFEKEFGVRKRREKTGNQF